MMRQLPADEENARMLLMTPFFSSSVCHASGTEQEIHPHRENEDQYDKTGLIHILLLKGSWPADRQEPDRSAVLIERKEQRQAQVLSNFPAMVIMCKIGKM